MHQTAPESVPALQGNQRDLSLPRNAWYSPFSFEVAGQLVRHLPHPLTRSIAAAVGGMGYRFCPDRRAALLSNLAPLNGEDAGSLSLASFQTFFIILPIFSHAPP